MGKKSRAKAARRQLPPSTTPTPHRTSAPPPSAAQGPDRQVVTATYRLLTALEAYAREVHRHREQTKVVALPPTLTHLLDYVASTQAQLEAQELQEAWSIVDGDEPVYGAAHHRGRANEAPRRWRGPLTPDQILAYADGAPADQLTYREHMALNEDFFTEREQTDRRRLSATCQRPTQTGTPCRTIPVYMPAPDGDFDPAYACWRHLSDEQTATVATTYRAAVRHHDCPGCDATAGRACYTGPDDAMRMRLLDNGEWAKVRRFKDHKVHSPRLHLTTA